MTETTGTTPHYGTYLKIWVALLVITVVMVFTHKPAILIPGMAAKATLIALWFMHLKDERRDFIFYVVASIIVFSAVLFGLIAPDGHAM